MIEQFVMGEWPGPGQNLCPQQMCAIKACMLNPISSSRSNKMIAVK